MKRLMIFAGLLGVAAAGMAQERLTLQEAVATALEKNAAVMVARNNASIARNTAQSGMADMLPKLTASAGASYTDIDNISTNTVSSAGLNLSYTLFDGLGNVYRLKQARATGRMGALDARNQIENTILQVSQAYYGAASAFEGLSIAREAMGISRERLTRAKQRAAYGRAGTVDVLSAQVDVNSDSVNVVQARLAWDEAQRNLNVLLYRDLSKGMAIDTEVDYGVMDALDAFLSASTERNAGYLIYQERSRQAATPRLRRAGPCCRALTLPARPRTVRPNRIWPSVLTTSTARCGPAPISAGRSSTAAASGFSISRPNSRPRIRRCWKIRPSAIWRGL